MSCKFIEQTVVLRRGTSRELIIPVTDQDGNPFDLTNGNANWWVGTSVNATDNNGGIILKKDSTTQIGGISIVGPDPTGLFTLNVFLQAADTEFITPRSSYYHEASVVDRGFNVYVVSGGAFMLLPSMTPDQFIPHAP